MFLSDSAAEEAGNAAGIEDSLGQEVTVSLSLSLSHTHSVQSSLIYNSYKTEEMCSQDKQIPSVCPQIVVLYKIYC